MNSFLCPIHKFAQEQSDHLGLITPTQQFTYVELEKTITTAANQLAQYGVQAGTRVGVWIEDPLDGIITVYALWRLKANPCFLNTRLPDDTIGEQLKKIQANILLSSQTLDFDFTIEQFNIAGIHQLTQQQTFAFSEHTPQQCDFSFDQSATILFTSGSSAQPKAAQHQLGQYYFSALSANKHIPFGAEDHWLLTLPLYHVGGMAIVWRVFLAGGTIVLPEGKSFLNEIQTQNVTHVSLVSTQLKRILDAFESQKFEHQLKAVLVGGSAIQQSLIAQSIEAQLPIYVTYGLTEMTSQVATSEKITSLENYRGARVLDEQEIKISADHEILCRGRTLFAGYIGQDSTLNDGWFVTGDLGELNEGYLKVWGRRDNMFISGGENIQPEEIEQCLAEVDVVEQSIVVPVDHVEFGQRPVVFIQLNKKVKVEKSQLSEHLKTRLPKYKCPDCFYYWPDEYVQSGIKMNRQFFKELVRVSAANLKAIE